MEEAWVGDGRHDLPTNTTDTTHHHQQQQVRPSYSVACAVLCAALTFLGFITTSVLGNCGKGPQPADMADDDDVGQ